MDLQLQDSVVLITGGSKGIGLATARAFAGEGCRLHLAARTETDLETARAGIAADFGVEVTVHPVDLSRGEHVRRLAEACGTADILINNAGAIPGGRIEVMSEAAWREAWELKVFGYINMMREYYLRMKQRGRGVIVNIIGNAGNQPPAEYAAGVSAAAIIQTAVIRETGFMEPPRCYWARARLRTSSPASRRREKAPPARRIW
jgi:NAD(P)-dependent dehydrogenase (short-subunit alcohol dehydrogenase family)